MVEGTCPPIIDISKLEGLMQKNNDILTQLNETMSKVYKTDGQVYHSLIASQVVIAKHDIFESSPVNNPKYNRGRIFCDAIFTPAHSGGLTIELWYGNQYIGDVMVLKSVNGSGSGTSEPIDIGQLSGFKFIVRNHDQSQNTTIRNFKIVMYIEGVTLANQL